MTDRLNPISCLRDPGKVNERGLAECVMKHSHLSMRSAGCLPFMAFSHKAALDASS